MRYRMASLAAAGSLAAGCLMLPGTASAQAAAVPCTAIGANVKALTGSGTNRVEVKLCGWRTVVEDLVEGFADVDWLIEDPGITFTKFKVQTRIEKRSTTNGADAVVSTSTCDIATALNSAAQPRVPERCAPSELVWYDSRYWWSTDATVTYDIEGDAQGDVTWHLTGSPLVPAP
ncbi:hypothetical protein [Streptomyces uncialis]|uniref:hypothetical protein n=1 Tax=Streptomyces uncialis TaxID=1048205 RepID=UPI002250C0E4|nr:hypothetical protein [Streptomyces uncialis]MCX4659224.1 hypothetical protein [Streptomyces uncialis]